MADFTTELFEVDPLHPDPVVIEAAADLIRAGEVVAFPTETVYGLGADATNSEAVSKIFVTKRRPSDNPLIAHFSSITMLEQYVDDIPDIAYRLADVFWPGPLTLVLPKTDRFATEVTKDLPTVAVRIPAHPVAKALIDAAGVPIAAPSANLSGRPSPTTAYHVLSDFDGAIPLIIDGGSTSVGVESTVLNVLTQPPSLLRPGGVTIEELQQVTQLAIPDYEPANEAPPSPGMKYTHYSPDSEVILVPQGQHASASKLDSFAAKQHGSALILCTNTAHHHAHPSIQLGSTLQEVQLNLFASLRLLDDQDHACGIFEGVSTRRQGFAIMNRVAKAANRTVNI